MASEAADTAIARLRPLALRSLAAMYDDREQTFAFRVRPGGEGVVREGLSPRYTAITLIGLATATREEHGRVLGRDRIEDVSARLSALAPRMENLGDVALTLWAVQSVGTPTTNALEDRLVQLDPVRGGHPTVEVAWALVAACTEGVSPRVEALRGALARRLIEALHPRSHLFPHLLGRFTRRPAHVACFADLVYPIHALSTYAALTGDPSALSTAAACAERVCERQGEGGQWWWHYDYRTGDVIERYPVYAIHQDAMGPMALFALRRAGGPDFSDSVERGVQWLLRSPELDGGSLIDTKAEMIWRKVARREPGKLSRYLNAAATTVYAPLRAPAVDFLFPAGAIDREDRPYHFGWMLFAWSDSPVAAAPEQRTEQCSPKTLR